MEKYLLPNIYCEKAKKVKNYPDIIGKFWAEKNPPISGYRASNNRKGIWSRTCLHLLSVICVICVSKNLYNYCQYSVT